MNNNYERVNIMVQNHRTILNGEFQTKHHNIQD